jgi:alpha-tubulin suppressor-like RCC1 family protein
VCAVRDDGAGVKCWGLNTVGQLGLGDTINRGDVASTMGEALPLITFGVGRTVSAISTGGCHNCVVLDNGVVKCWGLNTRGELGFRLIALIRPRCCRPSSALRYRLIALIRPRLGLASV